MDNREANPNAEIPYKIPKFAVFALRRCSGVTSSRGTLYIFDAVIA